MKTRLFLAVCIFLTACINVDNFGVYWKKGIIDSRLKGGWVQPKTGDCIEFLPEGDSYHFLSSNDGKEVARTLMVGNHYFLMIKKDGMQGGRMVRYDINGDGFLMYNFDASKKNEFQEKYANSNIILTDRVTIKQLDESAIQIIEKIADDQSYWTFGSAYQSKSCNP